jgi:hypothetical protein
MESLGLGLVGSIIIFENTGLFSFTEFDVPCVGLLKTIKSIPPSVFLP